MKHTLSCKFKNIRLRPLKQEDCEFLRMWRNNSDNSKYLRKIDYITPEMQLKWFSQNMLDDEVYTFAIEETETYSQIVGSISLYNFKHNTAEYGRIMVGEKKVQGKGVGFLALLMCIHIGFAKLGLEAIVASVHENNKPARKMNEKIGFEIIGKHPFDGLNDELEIIIKKDEFYKKHNYLTELEVIET